MCNNDGIKVSAPSSLTTAAAGTKDDSKQDLLHHEDSYTRLLTKQFSSNAQVDREIDRLKLQHDMIAPIVRKWIEKYGRLSSTISGESDEEKEVIWVDLGCGTGHDVELIRRILEKHTIDGTTEKQKFEVVGMDINSKLLKQARDTYEKNLIEPSNVHVSFQNGSATAIPLPDGSVDCIFAKFVLQHIEGEARTQVLSEMKRILRPGGRALIVDVDDGSGFFLRPEPENFQEMTKQFNKECASGDRLVVRKLPPILRQVGFDVVRMRTESVVGGIDEKFTVDDVMQTFYNWRFNTLRDIYAKAGTVYKVDRLFESLEAMGIDDDAVAMYPIFLVLAERSYIHVRGSGDDGR